MAESLLVMVTRKILNFFKKGSGARDVATLTIGTAVAQGLAIAVMPLLSRLYSPGDFGLLAVFLAVSSVAATLVTLRYEAAILVPKENDEAANLLMLSLVLAMIGAALLVFLSIFLPESARVRLGVASLGGWFSLAFIVAGAAAVMAAVQGWLNRQKNYTQMAKLRVVQSVVVVGLGLMLGVFPGIGYGLLLAQTLACLFAVVPALFCLRSAALTWRHKKLLSVAKAHINTPRYLLPTAILDVLTLQMPVILIANWFDEGLAGQFSMAWRLLMLPMSLIGAAVGQVFLQRFAQVRAKPELAKKMLKKTWGLLFAAGIMPMALVFFFGEEIFSLVLGDAWREAGAMASVMAPMVLAMLISSPTSGTYVILGLQKFSLVFGALVFLYRPACLYFGYASNNFMSGIVAWAAIDIAVIFLYQFIAWKKIN